VVDTHSVYLGSALKHLAHFGRQVPCALTPAELLRRGGTLTLSNVGAIGAGESTMPVLMPGGGITIVARGGSRTRIEPYKIMSVIEQCKWERKHTIF
jgi:2-oxoisovalerate dehydrogenase E2 component (dihydrolipoyl transacylase)